MAGLDRTSDFPHQYPSASGGHRDWFGAAYYADVALQENDGTMETLTRPRITKEQVDVFEAHFQAHPKPNSMVKRQLAAQTKLTLPRVAVSRR